jgi:hypothetical protein
MSTKKTARTVVISAIALLTILATGFLAHTFRTSGSAARIQVLVDTTGLRNGDLLFRNGYGAESRLVTEMSRSNYSHIAFAYRAPQGWAAVHAVPGETENPKDTDYLKVEPIEEFFHKERARSGATARVACSDETAQKALEYALDKVKRKFAFDHEYRLADTTEYYCTELIYRAYLTQEIDLAEERKHELPMPGTERYFIFPSDILSSKSIKAIRELKTDSINP